jgi:hypothetical protein
MANLAMSRGHAYDEEHVTVTANQTSVYSLGADGALYGGNVVGTSKGSYPMFADPAGQPPADRPSGMTSNGGYLDHGMYSAPMTPGMPNNVGVTTKDRAGKSTEGGVVTHGGNWTGPDHPSDAATHTASRDSSGGQDKT